MRESLTYTDPFGLCKKAHALIAWLTERFSKPCATRDEAATRAIEDTEGGRSPAMRRRREWGGEVVESEGGFRYTPNRPGRQTSFTPNPRAAGYAGYYHTHPSFPGYDAERFSNADMEYAERTGQPGYVLTQRGIILKYDPDNDQVIIIRPGSEER